MVTSGDGRLRGFSPGSGLRACSCPALKEVPVSNRAFDVTPARLITGLITDRGIIRPPFRKTIRQLLAR